MKNLLSYIANIGLEKDSPFDLRNKLRVFNNAIIVILFISLFYTIIGIVNHYTAAVTVTFFSLFSNVLALFLISKKKYKIAFHYTMWYAFLFLSAFSFLFGGANNSYYYFLFLYIIFCSHGTVQPLCY